MFDPLSTSRPSPESSSPNCPQPNLRPNTQQYQISANRMRGYFLGPLPISDFLDKNLVPRPNRPEIKFPASPLTAHEITRSVLSAMPILAPTLHVYDTRGRNHIDEAVGFTTSLSFYPNPVTKSAGGSVRADFAEMELFARVWPHERDDPFSDEGLGRPNRRPFELVSGRTARGILLACAAAVLTLQHRTRVFSFAIFGAYARLMCWDRSGVIVSERFKFREDDHLMDFLWRFDQLKPWGPGRGHDVTVTRVEEPWPTHLAPSDILERLKNSSHHQKPRQHRYFCLMKVPDGIDPTQETDVLVSSPSAYSLDDDFAIGMAMSSFHAYDVQQSRLVFVKQYWRLSIRWTTKEGDLLTRLAEKRVPNVPAFSIGNDVRNAKSRHQLFQRCRSITGLQCANRLRTRQLYRILQENITLQLSQVRSLKELVSVVRDAMSAHDAAFFHAGILHCNITVDNIVIDAESRAGVLVNWEVACDFTRYSSVDFNQLGAWEFASSKCLQFPTTPHELADDRESALYVLTWVIIKRFHLTLESKGSVCPELMFTEPAFLSGNTRERFGGGPYKAYFLRTAALLSDTTLEDDQQITHLLITHLRRAFAQRYPYSANENNVTEEYRQRVAPLSRQHWLVDQLDLALNAGPFAETTSIPTHTTGQNGNVL